MEGINTTGLPPQGFFLLYDRRRNNNKSARCCRKTLGGGKVVMAVISIFSLCVCAGYYVRKTCISQFGRPLRWNTKSALLLLALCVIALPSRSSNDDSGKTLNQEIYDLIIKIGRPQLPRSFYHMKKVECEILDKNICAHLRYQEM
jgi:hypothetical protein